MKIQVMIAGTLAPALLLAGCHEETKAPEPVRPVLSMLVEPNHGDRTVAVGVVEPRYKTNLGFRVLGRLTSRPVYVGDLVSEGQIVGALDPTALDLAVRLARAQLAKAQAQLATAKATEERQRTLITSDATTRQTLDNAEQARAGAEATVAHEQANLTKAIEQLGYAQIKADFGGVVTAVGAEVGQVVSPAKAWSRSQGPKSAKPSSISARIFLLRSKSVCRSPSACNSFQRFRSKAGFAKSRRRPIR